MARTFSAASTQYLIGNTTQCDVTGQAITVCAWFKPSGFTTQNKLVSRWPDTAPTSDRQYLLCTGGSGNAKPLFATNSGATASVATGATTLSTGTWYHMLGTKDASNIKVYLNGTQDGTAASTTTLVSTAPDFKIGAGGRAAVHEALVNGTAAEVAIWNAVLSAEEIAVLARGMLPKFVRPQSLVGYYPLWGLHSSEIGLVSGNPSLTVTNSPAQANHPPVRMAS